MAKKHWQKIIKEYNPLTSKGFWIGILVIVLSTVVVAFDSSDNFIEFIASNVDSHDFLRWLIFSSILGYTIEKIFKVLDW